MFLRLNFLTLMMLAASCAWGGTMDFRNFTQEDFRSTGFAAPNWFVSLDGSTAGEISNSYNTVLFSDKDILSGGATQAVITGTVFPTTNANNNASGFEDDFFGFVLGFNPGDATSPVADYLLIDWKGVDQSFNFTGGIHDTTGGGLARRGLAISRVSGAPTADELWTHRSLANVATADPQGGVTELQRGLTQGLNGYNVGGSHAFRIEFSTTQVKVFVDGTLELDIAGSFSNGRFGLYESHQNLGATFTEFSKIANSVVPEPSSFSVMGLISIGIMFCRRRKR